MHVKLTSRHPGEQTELNIEAHTWSPSSFYIRNEIDTQLQFFTSYTQKEEKLTKNSIKLLAELFVSLK